MAARFTTHPFDPAHGPATPARVPRTSTSRVKESSAARSRTLPYTRSQATCRRGRNGSDGGDDRARVVRHRSDEATTLRAPVGLEWPGRHAEEWTAALSAAHRTTHRGVSGT